MTTDATWRATLREVKRQALLHLKSPNSADASSGNGGSDAEWVKVEGPEPKTPEWSELWPQQQWQIAFEILFCQMPPSAKSLQPHQDDLLFFVNATPAQDAPPPRAAGGTSSGAGGALFVRRRAKHLPEELQLGGSRSGGVDWRASVLLNLVLQTGYCLEVATCRHADLGQLVDREGPATPACAGAPATTPAAAGSSTSSSSSSSSSTGAPGIGAGGRGATGEGSLREVCKVVYASPSRVPLHLDSSRGSSREPAPCYPDICFAVEDFEDAFASVLLTHPDDCYCVLLYAEARDSWNLGVDPPHPPVTVGATGTAAAAPAPGAPPSQPPTDSVAWQLAGLQLLEGGTAAGAAPEPASGGRRSTTHRPMQAAPSKLDNRGGEPHKPPSQQQEQQQPQQQQPQPQQQPPQGGGVPLVFSGFVSHQLLSDAMAPKLTKGGGLLGGGRGAQHTSRVMMRGPEGMGGADVAVTSMAAVQHAQHEEGSLASEPASNEGAGGSRAPGVPLFLAKASRMAKGVVEAAKKAAASGGLGEGARGGPLQLKCALMTLMVPVDMAAASILEAL